MKKFATVFSLVLCVAAAAATAQDTKLKILEKPRPELPQNHNTLDIHGSVVLNIQFLDFGEIGEITPVKTLPADLTQRAVVAARKIKFEPEIKDGKPVTVVREIEYVYSWNGGWSFPTGSDGLSPAAPGDAGKADQIIEKAIDVLGGNPYLRVRTQIGKGKYSVIRDGGVVSFQSFVDVIVFPDKERTEFRGPSGLIVQTNTGGTGWIFDAELELIKVQNEAQIAGFKRSIRTSLDNLLRGYWKGDGEIAYVGRRPSTLGKRNDVVRLTYKDGFTVEYEFSDDGLPQKAIHKRLDADNEEIREEDRYAQFIDINGIKTPYIIDRFTNGKPTSRINYESVEFNRTFPDSIFAKPQSVKDAKKSPKY